MNLNVKQVKNHFYVSEGRKIYSHDIAPIINCREDKVMWQRPMYLFWNVSLLLSCNGTKHYSILSLFCHSAQATWAAFV